MEERLRQLEMQMKNLQQAFIQSQQNNVPVTAKTDNAAYKVEQITPYTATKTAYIGDTEVIFSGVEDGNLSVFAKDTEGRYPACTAERSGDTVRVSFDPLENVTEITLSIS